MIAHPRFPRRVLQLLRERGDVGLSVLQPRLGALEGGGYRILPVCFLFHVLLEGLIVLLCTRYGNEAGERTAK